MTINADYSKHAGKMTKFNNMEIFQIVSVIFQEVTCTSSMCLNCTRFEEYQRKGVRRVDYTKYTVVAVYSKHAGKMTKFNYMEIFRKMSEHFQKVTPVWCNDYWSGTRNVLCYYYR